MWSEFSGVFPVVISVISVLALSLAARNAIALSELQARWKSSFDALSTLQHSSSPASLLERFTELETTVETLANRVKMQRVRNAANHATEGKPTGFPDPYKEPDAWRNAVNARLARAKFGV